MLYYVITPTSGWLVGWAGLGRPRLQKDSVLEELERLTEGLVEQARASHDPAFELSVRMNDARRAAQQLTRRMMATVSELSLYQVCIVVPICRCAAGSCLWSGRARLLLCRSANCGYSSGYSSPQGPKQIFLQFCELPLSWHTMQFQACRPLPACRQALSLKYAADKESLQAELAAAKRNMAERRPPTAGADQVCGPLCVHPCKARGFH